ncbi:MAG: hypothetical protein KC501_21645 [Myxococcales bacterium]|nr:hypothetical protein [Myxococcales bacterium]
MIFSLDQLHDAGSVFHGNGGDPLEWTSRLPDLSVFGFGADPALAADLWNGQQVAQLAMRNVASALRLASGRVAVTQGFTATQLPALSGLFTDSLDTLYGGIDLASKILGTEVFTKALDSLGWIPIAGWALELVVGVVELVTSIVKAVGDRREARARESLARVATVPLAQWSQGADEVLARTMMMRLGQHDAQWLVSPRYPATSATDFRAKAEVVNPGDERWAGWIVYTGDGPGVQGEGSPGLGFIPGTRNLHGAMELRTRGARDLRDLGAFYPTARMAAVQWWEMIVAGGPAMFSIDAGAARRAWADYLRSAIDFGDHVLSGWSTSTTATGLDSTSHTCVPELYGIGECRKVRRNKMVPIVGTGHRSAYLDYLMTLFEPRRHDPDRGWERDNIDWDDTLPGRALANLEQRQQAVLQSLACMTVDDSDVDGVPRFRAIGTATNKGPLWQRWYDSVVAVFQSGDWRRVRFEDVPEGALKQELRDRCAYEGIDCTTLGHQNETSFAPAPSSLGDPVPPTPPNPAEIQLGYIAMPEPGRPPTRRRFRPMTWALAAGVVGGVWALSRRR